MVDVAVAAVVAVVFVALNEVTVETMVLVDVAIVTVLVFAVEELILLFPPPRVPPAQLLTIIIYRKCVSA